LRQIDFLNIFFISEGLVASWIAVKFGSNTNHERVGNVLRSFGKNSALLI
jgi:hypothetical protein